jgi:hypothetical protein
LGRFIRYEPLKVFFAGIALYAFVSLVIALVMWAARRSAIPSKARQSAPARPMRLVALAIWAQGSAVLFKVPQSAAARAIRATILRLGLLLVMLVAVSVVAGRVQDVSYERFATFFVPLLLLFGVAGCSWVLFAPFPNRFEWIKRLAAPAMLLCAVLVSWQVSHKFGHDTHWATRVGRATLNGFRFFDGTYSLADAYSHQDTGLPFGGINPEALEAWRRADPPAPIWSTNVDSYCMVPGCVIESIASFKLSDHFDDIVTGPPELAKRLLKDAGINYFLFLKESRLLDLLPYSPLFARDTIGQHLGMKWTDGSAYLLTWIGPETTPLSADFYNAYDQRIGEPESQWFQYAGLSENIEHATVLLRQKTWGTAPVFPWRIENPTPGDVEILVATYGRNCRSFQKGNRTAILKKLCRHQTTCTFEAGPPQLGDPAGGCDKDFSVGYRCTPDETPTIIKIPPSPKTHTVTLDCRPGLHVLQETYGRSCYFQSRSQDNFNNVIRVNCDNMAHCDLSVETVAVDDPTVKCDTAFSLEYVCRPGGVPRTIHIDPAANGKTIALDCPKNPG